MKASEVGVVFMLDPHGRTHDGRRVFLFGKVPVVIADGVVHAKKAGGNAFAPVSVRELEGMVRKS